MSTALQLLKDPQILAALTKLGLKLSTALLERRLRAPEETTQNELLAAIQELEVQSVDELLGLARADGREK